MSRLNRESVFVTLTYDDAHLPEGGTLCKADVQKFLKRLRHHGFKFSYLHAGEYGDEKGRPHYHLILFGIGWDELELTPWEKRSNQYVAYRSAVLERHWGKGLVEVGTATQQSIAYCTQYVTKKLFGASAEATEVYRREAADQDTGEVREWYVVPEYMTWSKRPALGLEYFNEFRDDVFPSSFVVINGEKRPVPRYFSYRMKKHAKGVYAPTAAEAKARAKAFEASPDGTRERIIAASDARAYNRARHVRVLDVRGGASVDQ